MLYDTLYYLYNFHVNVNNYVVELSVNLYLSQSPLHHTATHRNTGFCMTQTVSPIFE